MTFAGSGGPRVRGGWSLGASILEVSRLPGHQDVSTTAWHYAGIGDATLARVIDRSDAAEQVTGSNVLPIRVVGGRKGG